MARKLTTAYSGSSGLNIHYWILSHLCPCSGMGLSMLAMATGLHLKQLASASSTIAIAGTVAYMVFFALGAGPVPGLLVPEVTPARLRGEPSQQLRRNALSSSYTSILLLKRQEVAW